MSIMDAMREKLACLAPTDLMIVDDSAKHVGHAGAREGGHFTLNIVAVAFAGKSRLENQRLVFSLIGDLKDAGIHALSVTARAPEKLPL